MKKFLFALLLVPVLLTGCNTQEAIDTLDSVSKTIDGAQKVASASEVPPTNESNDESYDQVLYFNDDKYPETANHIETAIEKGESSVCTIDRDGADANRDDSLDGVPTKKGYDRDEWPMAMCEEGGTGADIMYITPSDNRGAGSWVSHQLSHYPDGTKVKFVVGNE